MFDLSSLSNTIQIISGVGVGATGFWKFFIAPGRKFRADIFKRLNALDERIKKLESDGSKFKDSLQAEIDGTDKDFEHRITQIQKDQDDLKDTLKEHIRTVETKNNQLLDLIIKYFTEKD
jgi:gas vesicle protein